MKKIIAFVITALLLVSVCALGVSAAGGINANEQKILDKLSSTVTSNGKSFSIPVEYVNQAKNYFLADNVDVTDAQVAEILKYIGEGEAIVKEQENKLKAGTNVDIAVFEFETKQKILDLGKKSCAVIGLTLTYENKQVKIVDANNKTAFIDAPIVKVTGAEASVAVSVIAAAVVILGFAAAAIASKKVTVR